MANAGFGDRHHWDWSGCREPIGLVIATGVITDVVEVTEHKRHSAESLQAGARHTKILSMRSLVSFHVEQTVSVPHLGVVVGARGHLVRLAVADEEESRAARDASVALRSRRTGLSFRTVQPISSGRSRLSRPAVNTGETRCAGQASFTLGSSGARETGLTVSS